MSLKNQLELSTGYQQGIQDLYTKDPGGHPKHTNKS